MILIGQTFAGVQRHGVDRSTHSRPDNTSVSVTHPARLYLRMRWRHSSLCGYAILASPGEHGNTMFRCKVCGWIHDGIAPPNECPSCGAPADRFRPMDAAEINLTTNELASYGIVGPGSRYRRRRYPANAVARLRRCLVLLAVHGAVRQDAIRCTPAMRNGSPTTSRACRPAHRTPISPGISR